MCLYPNIIENRRYLPNAKNGGNPPTPKDQRLNEKSVGYCVKYVSKADPVHKEFNGKIFASKGLGKSFLNRGDKNINKFDGENTKEYYRTPSGIKIALPMYYRNKIWTEEEREQLWLQKLNAGDRYVRGDKIKKIS